MLGIIRRVKNDAEFKNYICRIVSKRLGAVLVNFNVNGVVFRKIFVLSAWVILGIIYEVKQYADYENMIAEWISRRLVMVLITLMPLWVAYHRNLHFFGYIELGTVSYIFKGKVGFG